MCNANEVSSQSYSPSWRLSTTFKRSVVSNPENTKDALRELPSLTETQVRGTRKLSPEPRPPYWAGIVVDFTIEFSLFAIVTGWGSEKKNPH